MAHQQKKLAVVTGASSGIGLELARVFAKNDFDLIIAAEDAKINDVAKLLRQYEVEVIPIQVDLALLDQVENFYRQVKSYGREIDCLALNAGVGVGGEFISTDFNKELNLINLNIVALVQLTKLALQDMSNRNEGRILITSSIAGEAPGPYLAVYAASKAFVQSFAEAVRFELKDTHKNISITSLQPGATDTDFFERAEMLDTKVGQAEKDDPVIVAQDGFDALMAGKDHVVGGSFKNKIEATASKLMSQEQAAKAHAKTTKPGSSNDIST